MGITLIGLLALVVVHLVSARVCYLGNEPDSERDSELRWVLRPGSDPCQCTSVMLGGVNAARRPTSKPIRPNPESLLHSTSEKEVREHLDCPVRTDPPTVSANGPQGAADCQALYDQGTTTSGVYIIYPSPYPNGLEVYCDMDDGGWIVFQKRGDGTVSFTRNWASYRDGFGNPAGEFWLGNEAVHQLTSAVPSQTWTLRVDLQSNDGSSGHAVYEDFSVGNEGAKYALHADSFSQPASDDMGDSFSTEHNGKSFSTYDQDNDDNDDKNCAETLKGGWWFARCDYSTKSNLNGEYSYPIVNWYDDYRGIGWDSFSGGQIQTCQMKMRHA